MDEFKNYAEPGIGQSLKDSASEIQRKADSAISGSAGRVAHTLDNVCHSLRESADESEKEYPVIGKYVRSAADSMERFSESLKHKDMDFFVRGTEEMARKQPGVFLGSAFTVGLALGRFLKGRTSHGYSSYHEETPNIDEGMAPIAPENDPGDWRSE